MHTTALIAKHLRELYFGGNWTCSSFREHLAELDLEQALVSLEGLNSIAVLVAHTHYYIVAVTAVLEGRPLTAKDTESFKLPPLQSENDWQQLLDQVWAAAEHLAELIVSLPEERLQQDFTDTKYGSYYRNLQGIIEHSHYHLGQIVLIRKLLERRNATGIVA